MTKCSKAKETVCDSMREFAADQYGSGRRIFRSKTYNIKTKKQGIGAAYQFTSKRKDFVWLNFCPWCGGKWYVKERKTKP
jgi:hypothetical protein